MFTDNGKVILAYMKTVPGENLKARDIADNLGLSAKTVSGSMRKLVSDGFIEKIGKDPIIYTITNKGKEITID
jgi:predicted transcriptional regulator